MTSTSRHCAICGEPIRRLAGSNASRVKVCLKPACRRLNKRVVDELRLVRLDELRAQSRGDRR